MKNPKQDTINKRNRKHYQKYHIAWFLLVFLITAPVVLNGCSSGLRITSDWRQSDIIIDGIDSEWQRGLYYDKESDIVYGLRNDYSYFYLFLKTQNRLNQMQIMGSGLTIWFDKEGGNDHVFGIRYPLGRQDTHSEFHSDADEAQINSILDQSLIELEIIGPKKEDVRRYSALDVPGIKVKLTHLRGALVYELRVPLKKSTENPFAIEAASTNRIDIRIEAEEFNYSRIKRGLQPNEESGKGGGRSEPEDLQMENGKHEGRGHHRSVQANKEKPKPLDLKLSVQLAGAPSAG